MYIIYDKQTDEYETTEGYWYTLLDGKNLDSDTNVFPTRAAAERHLDDYLKSWDKAYTTPLKSEFQIRKVRSTGWVFDEDNG